MIHLRCSELPTLARCSKPVELRIGGEPMIYEDNDAGPFGSATHEAVANYITTGRPGDLHAIAKRHGLTDDDLEELPESVAYTIGAWRKFADAFPNPQVEVAFDQTVVVDGEDINLTGHCDVLAINGTAAIVGDFKTGRVERDYYHQMMGYAWQVFAANADILTVDPLVIYSRLGTYERYPTVTRADAQRWFDDTVIGLILDRMHQYHAGEQCVYCPAFASCGARIALASDVVNILGVNDSGKKPHPIREWSTELRTKVWDGVAVLEKSIERFRKTAKQDIGVGGPLELDGDKVVTLTPVVRERIKTREAWPVLCEAMTEAELADAITVRKSVVTETIYDRATYGCKKTDVDSFMARLRAANATDTTTSFSMTVKAANKEAGDGDSE